MACIPSLFHSLTLWLLLYFTSKSCSFSRFSSRIDSGTSSATLGLADRTQSAGPLLHRQPSASSSSLLSSSPLTPSAMDITKPLLSYRTLPHDNSHPLSLAIVVYHIELFFCCIDVLFLSSSSFYRFWEEPSLDKYFFLSSTSTCTCCCWCLFVIFGFRARGERRMSSAQDKERASSISDSSTSALQRDSQVCLLQMR